MIGFDLQGALETLNRIIEPAGILIDEREIVQDDERRCVQRAGFFQRVDRPIEISF